MKEELKKVESVKTKRFTVLENGQEVLKTDKTEEVDNQIKKLQEELKPKIVLIDNKEKKSTHYTKSIHQRNYRVQAGNYENDSVLKPAPEVTKTEE